MDVSALTKNLHSEHALQMAALSLREDMEKQLTRLTKIEKDLLHSCLFELSCIKEEKEHLDRKFTIRHAT